MVGVGPHGLTHDVISRSFGRGKTGLATALRRVVIHRSVVDRIFEMLTVLTEQSSNAGIRAEHDDKLGANTDGLRAGHFTVSARADEDADRGGGQLLPLRKQSAVRSDN